jgi:hypothetical protein
MQTNNSMTYGKTMIVAVAMLGMTAGTGYAASGTFSRLAGTWSGGGTVMMSDGQVERIRCRAEADVADHGDSMRQHLRCASDSYNFDIQNEVTARGGEISGNWDESTHNISGQISGTASPERVQARVDGGSFSADVTMVSRGNSLRVTLDPQGSDVRQVEVVLRRI